MLLSRISSAVVTAALAVLPLRAAADPAPTDIETARSLMDEGDVLQDQGDLWGALERFQAADHLMHVPTTTLELARIQATLLQLVEARATAFAAARIPVAPGEPNVQTEARAAAGQLAADLGGRIPDLTLDITPQSANDTVTIDGSKLPNISRKLAYKLNPGAHTVSVEAPGFSTQVQRIPLAERQHAHLQVKLSAEPVTPVAQSTRPKPDSAPSATEDGNAPGRKRGIIGLSIGGAALVAGLVAGVVSLTTVSDVRSRCQGQFCPEETRGDLSTADTLATVANITIPLGVAAMGYGLFELLTHLDAAPVREGKLQVSVMPLGFALRGEL